MLDIFMEDWDGEVVLSDVRNFKDEKDFLEKASKYVQETRGYNVPLFAPTKVEVVFNPDNEEHCWMGKKSAVRVGFKGETITVYRSDLGY